MTKTCSTKSRKGKLSLFFINPVLQSTVREVDLNNSQQGRKTAACVASQRKTDIKNRDLQEEINKFVKWGDENSPEVQFDQVQRYTVFREAAVFTSSASL